MIIQLTPKGLITYATGWVRLRLSKRIHDKMVDYLGSRNLLIGVNDGKLVFYRNESEENTAAK